MAKKGALNPKYYHPECASRAAAEKRGTVPAVTSAATVAPSIPEQIQKLAELRDAGILSEEEFTAKKADLLSRM
jgi:hypothetical protein